MPTGNGERKQETAAEETRRALFDDAHRRAWIDAVRGAPVEKSVARAALAELVARLEERAA